ncbi:MAG: multidrug efflux system membrane fusion protein [Verrucomicrobiales bacterium]|jgi:multidrug efflux system membrane fusion protein
MRILIRILLPIIILAAGWFGYTRLSVKEEQPKRPRPEPRVIRTEVLELKRQDFQTTVRTQGVVQPYLQAVLTAQVSGKVVSISESLQDGSFFIQGQELLKLDGADFEAAAFTAEANLAQAEARFAEESTKSKQARLNWQDLGYTDEPNELVLRLPQVRQAQANVKATMAALDLAIRNMERTSVTAPLTGRVLQRTTTVGQSINPSTSLATIFSTDFVEVRLPIAARDLAFLNLPESTAQAPVAALLNDAIQEGSETVWEASIHGTEGALDADSRELFAIARVADPFARQPGTEGNPPLRIGQPVIAEIRGKVLSGVFVIPRSAVRNLNNISLVDRDTLTIDRREIAPIWSDETIFVIQDETIPDGALLATSRMAYAPDDAKVEIVAPKPEVESEAIPEPPPPPRRYHK